MAVSNTAYRMNRTARQSFVFHPLRLLLASAALLCPAVPARAASPGAGHPGGNIAVQRAEDGRFLVAPDLRDTQKGQWWFYWNFAISAPAEIVFTKQNPIGVRGPAASYDGGATWRWLGAEAVKTAASEGRPAWSFNAELPAGAKEARFAFCPAYLESHLAAWIEKHRASPSLRVGELCKSRKGRGVELIRAGGADPAKARGVLLLTARHHCCETMASYAMEGLLDGVLADDEAGRAWRENWEVVAVPFMDKDGCEDGDQGKNRAPHDHNRDYNEQPLYPEVAALMKLGASLSNRVAAVLDLHCPHIRGAWNDRVYLVGAPEEAFAARQRAFAETWARLQQGPVLFRAADVLAFGTEWNKSANFAQGRSSSAWARSSFPSARLVTTIEIPYADALGVEINAANGRALGRDIARALAAHLAAP